MGYFRNKISKYISTYLSTHVVLAVDVAFASIASLCALFFIQFLPTFSFLPKYFSLLFIISAAIGTVTGDIITNNYRAIIRHSDLRDIWKLTILTVIKEIIIAFIFLLTHIFTGNISLYTSYTGIYLVALLVDLCLTLIFLVGVRVSMMWAYSIFRKKFNEEGERIRVLVYGTKSKAVSLLTLMSTSKEYYISGFVSPSPFEKEFKIAGREVLFFNNDSEFLTYTKKHHIGALLFAHLKDAYAEGDHLVPLCADNNIRTLVAPKIDILQESENSVADKNVGVRNIKIEDLLGRDEVKLDMNEIKSHFGDKVIMVTGAAGSIGSELCRQLATFGIKQLILYDNGETAMLNLRLELEEKYPELDFVPVIGDVRQLTRLDYAFRKWHPQIVFHAAAYKHVPLMEENPCEAVLVNAVGTRYVADKCVEYGIEKMIMVSTDKAVNPTNIMGCTKRLAEIYVQSLGIAIENGEINGHTRFVTTRFGNVLGSNGSVIPHFRNQIEKGGPVTVTHPDITRFFMSIPEACRLVMVAATMPQYNKIFIFDMGEPVKINDLAKKMISLAGYKPDKDIKIIYSGLRPGEKLYEEVLAKKEETESTGNSKIRIARIRPGNYSEVLNQQHILYDLAVKCQVDDIVKLMKQIVPEFKSKNSRFEAFDVPKD